MNNIKFKDYLNEQLKDDEFKKEWDALEDEYNFITNLVKARKDCKITQKTLSETTGISQSEISKIENGNGNPSLSTISRLAKGMGMKLKIDFVPNN